MRPVTRGLAPRTYRKYGDAIGDLEERLGIYCSYCERRLPASLAVEHVVPKSLVPELETTWDNFLLGCTNCNSVKLNQPTNKRDFLWPDVDNTMRAYSYSPGGFVDVADGLTTTMSRKAKKLMDLVGLDRHEAEGRPAPAPRDKRWQQRKDAWDAAVLAKARLAELNNAPAAMDLVLIAAEGFGFFSIWMTVFADHPAIKRALVQRFKGTADDCFDPNFDPVARPRGRL
ncbi:MAG: HNH endonuclease [Prosthecobacter sp.]|jgi:hypothetical protein|uniref:HNH endonuclease n=1 Tax=Prosthecobacter sp. TaxID=1965333 RepID=UPI001A0DE252|nr:HNH endonuclease [Prosthecobacter sp.]MBE2287417.1 HNH endonuclease [Prosthecobacter sp.]